MSPCGRLSRLFMLAYAIRTVVRQCVWKMQFEPSPQMSVDHKLVQYAVSQTK